MQNLTHSQAAKLWPELMAYIDRGNAMAAANASASAWCEALRVDEACVRASEPSMVLVAEQDVAMRASFSAAARECGKNDYPYNAAIDEYLGLGGSDSAGRYMAHSVACAWEACRARAQLQALIDGGARLALVAARCKKTRRPIRFHHFQGPGEIAISGRAVAVSNGKRRFVLSSDWSEAKIFQNVIAAIEGQQALGA